MDDTSLVLQDAYGSVQLGRLPSNGFRVLASVISACINKPSVSRLSSPSTENVFGSNKKAKIVQPHSDGNVHFHLALLGLSLVEKMSSKLLDHELRKDLRLYTQNLFRVLNDEFGFILNAVSCV